MPKSLVLTPRVWYFAATASDDSGLESDFSNEVVLTNNTYASGVVLAWDASPSPNITNYKVYYGRTNGIYTNTVSANTNLTIGFYLTKAPKTNRVVTVTTYGATGMLTAQSIKGPWIHVDMTNVTLTNPLPSQFWSVEKPAKVFITEETY